MHIASYLPWLLTTHLLLMWNSVPLIPNHIEHRWLITLLYLWILLGCVCVLFWAVLPAVRVNKYRHAFWLQGFKDWTQVYLFCRFPINLKLLNEHRCVHSCMRGWCCCPMDHGRLLTCISSKKRGLASLTVSPLAAWTCSQWFQTSQYFPSKSTKQPHTAQLLTCKCTLG